jgi:hypothetical protein
MIEFFSILKYVGVVLLGVGLLMKPWRDRAMISTERRKYDAEMRQSLYLLVPAAVLIALGVIIPLVLFRGWLFNAGLLSLVVGLSCVWQMFKGNNSRITMTLVCVGLYGTLFGLAGVTFGLWQ